MLFLWFLLCGIAAAVVMEGFVIPILQMLAGYTPPTVQREPTAREVRRHQRYLEKQRVWLARQKRINDFHEQKRLARVQWQQRTGSSRLAAFLFYEP